MKTNERLSPGHEIYGDADQIMRIFTQFIMVVLAGLVIGIGYEFYIQDTFAAKLLVVVLLQVLVSLYFVRRNKVELTAALLTVVLISLITVIATNGRGIRQISVTAYPAVLVVASMVIQKRILVFLTLYNIACVAWLAFGEILGVYSPQFPSGVRVAEFWLLTIILTFTAFMAHLLAQALIKNNLRLQKELQKRKLIEDERNTLISELEIRNAESNTLRESAAVVASSLGVDETVSRILDQLQKVVPYDSASVQLLMGDELEIVGGRGFPEGKDAIGLRFILDEKDPAYPIVRERLPYILYTNIQSISDRFKGFFHDHIYSWMAIPLYTRGRLIGMLTMDGFAVNQFTEAHARFAVTFSNHVAVTLENARLYSDLQSELATRQSLISDLESKNAELERFAYTVSHDLKSPLFTIRGFLGYLEQDISNGNQQRMKSDMQRITDATDKMQQLLNELLEISRIGRLMNEPVSIPFEELAREAASLVQGRIMERGISVHIDVDMPVVYGDRPRLLEVVQNLIDNAAKFMGDQTDPRIDIGWDGEENGKPIFHVRDNGIGIPSEHHERVFGLFNKLDVKVDGTGIGLALVKRIIEVHGGRIWIESEPGKGSNFLFTLPVSPLEN